MRLILAILLILAPLISRAAFPFAGGGGGINKSLTLTATNAGIGYTYTLTWKNGLLTSASYPKVGGGGASIWTGILAYWTLDESSGTRYDVTGNGHDATAYSDTGLVVEPCTQALLTNEVVFDGTGYFSVESTAGQMDLTNSYTFGAWIRMTNTASDNVFFSRDDAGSDRSYMLMYGSDMVQWFHWNADGLTQVNATIASGGSLLPQGTNNLFVVVRFDTTNLTMFTNSVIASSVACANPPYASTNLLGIGTRLIGDVPNATANNSNRMADVFLFNRALTQNEINSLWNGGFGLGYGINP